MDSVQNQLCCLAHANCWAKELQANRTPSSYLPPHGCPFLFSFVSSLCQFLLTTTCLRIFCTRFGEARRRDGKASVERLRLRMESEGKKGCRKHDRKEDRVGKSRKEKGEETQ